MWEEIFANDTILIQKCVLALIFANVYKIHKIKRVVINYHKLYGKHIAKQFILHVFNVYH